MSGRTSRTTPDLLKNLRHLRVAVFHPKDADGDTLTRQLQRIGCEVLSFWPPLDELPDTVDVVVCAVRPEIASSSYAWARGERLPAVVAVIDYESPTIVDAAIKLGARGVLTAPVRTSGVLSSIVLALSMRDEALEARKRIARLEQKLESANQVSEAKAILARTRGISSDEAYRLLREQAMSRRVAVEQVARTVIQADRTLGAGAPCLIPARP